MITLYFFIGGSTKYIGQCTSPAVPRIGDDVKIKSAYYKVTHVTFEFPGDTSELRCVTIEVHAV
jgi:hypothetical protein